MSIPVRKGLGVLQEGGIKQFAARSSWHASIPVWNTVTSRYPVGTNVFDREWDLLVILDTCRVDALREVRDEIPGIGSVNRTWSVGSMSAEWMLNTFTESYREEIKNTAFVSGNIWSHRIFEERFHEHSRHDYDVLHRGRPDWNSVTADAFAHYEIVSGVANQDDRLHPENEAITHILTDRTITVGREKEFNRLIVHYTLPHLSFIADALDWEPEETSQEELMDGLDVRRDLRPEERSYDVARRGEVSRETVRDAYLQNLRLAIDYVEILLQNVDADTVVISADHGEAFGEAGMWGHPFGWPLPPVKTVPWATTTATDERTYEPRYEQLERPPTESETEEFLEAMGYL